MSMSLIYSNIDFNKCHITSKHPKDQFLNRKLNIKFYTKPFSFEAFHFIFIHSKLEEQKKQFN